MISPCVRRALREPRHALSRGMTMLELLICVTVIFVLIAILVPTMLRSRETARRAVCLSNLRQLNYSLLAYSNDYRGKTVPANTNSTGSGFWATILVPYSTKVDTGGSQQLLMNTLCPTASTLSGGIGSATTAWGPSTTYQAPGSPLVVGKQYGSYAMNGSLYSNNPPPPMVNILANPVGLIARRVSTGGNHSVYGDAIVTGNVSLSGNATITGTTHVWNGASVSGTSNVDYHDSNNPNDAMGMQVPDVVGFYNTLAATPGKQTMASIPNNTTFNFNTYPIIHITGNADFSKVNTVIGSGTVLVAGDVTKLPGSLLTFNIITLGSVNVKNGSLAGSIYAVGDADGNGHGTINGNLVTLGTYSGNGGPDIHATSFPSFDLTYYRPGQVTTINALTVDPQLVPTFADSIWAEGWPAIGDTLPTAAQVRQGIGNINSGMGRFYINRHNNGINVGFLDGHAENIPLTDLSTLKWSNQY